MLRVNFKETAWEEGLTVEGLLQKLTEDQSYALILRGRVMVIVNNEIISPSQFDNKMLQDGDEVRIYPAIGGG